jgi:RimJ/RimL family protein N-acetyltransferase
VIHFERSFDYELIRKIVTHDNRMYRQLVDDNSPRREDFYPVESEHVWYIVVRDIFPDCGPEEILGLWMMHPHNSICWEIHTALLPNAWGERALHAGRLVIEWIWENTPCRRLITNVPYNNRLALHFAYRAGMNVYGTNHQSWLKDGKLWDQICLGLSKPDKPARAEADAGLHSSEPKGNDAGGVLCH